MTLAMCATGCLVTTTPQFQEQQQTAPFLVAHDPDNRAFVVADDLVWLPVAHLNFGAYLVSEDASQPVELHMYLDYGVPTSIGGGKTQPFRSYTRGEQQPAGHLTDPPRLFNFEWIPPVIFDPGCHTVTLIASHHFDESSNCPTHLADSSQVVWNVIRCKSDDASQPCDIAELNQMKPMDGRCPVPVDACKDATTPVAP
jgi:hypothetical protein